jgi:hypothetical protein
MTSIFVTCLQYPSTPVHTPHNHQWATVPWSEVYHADGGGRAPSQQWHSRGTLCRNKKGSRAAEPPCIDVDSTPTHVSCIGVSILAAVSYQSRQTRIVRSVCSSRQVAGLTADALQQPSRAVTTTAHTMGINQQSQCIPSNMRTAQPWALRPQHRLSLAPTSLLLQSLVTCSCLQDPSCCTHYMLQLPSRPFLLHTRHVGLRGAMATANLYVPATYFTADAAHTTTSCH